VTGVRHRGRARPVADAPVAALAAAADDVARDWLLALLADAPLAAAADVPVARLAAEAPPLCAAMARALSDDGELDRLGPGGDLHAVAAAAGALAGAPGPAAAAAAVDALRAVLWTVALSFLPGAPAALVADLAARLATVAAAVTAAVLEAPAASSDPAPPLPAADPLSVPDAPDDGRLGVAAFAARDLRPRVTAGDPIAHLDERVAEHRVDGRTLGVLLVELDGVERLLAAGDEALEAIAHAELAIEGLLRPGDAARREAAGRIWITLPGTGPAGARALALRISVAVERAASHRGVPLTATVGIAVLPTDATDAAGLVDQAEEALFQARASGLRGPQPA
jgi:GGDEF domain-containing protein